MFIHYTYTCKYRTSGYGAEPLVSTTNMVQALYDNNRCTVQTNGTQAEGFKMTAGVRQGCPLSPLLYAICAELLIERFRMEIPSAVIRAYADDTAVLVQNIWTDTNLS